MPGGFHPPPSVIQSWPEPNYVNPEAKGKELLVISLVLTVLAIVFVGARLLVRWRIQKQLGWDDGLLALSLAFSIAQAVLFTYTETRKRWYRHVWDVPPQDTEFRQLHSWTVQLLFVMSTSCTKSSILLLYRRVIKGTVNPRFMLIVNSAVIFIFFYFVVYLLLMVLQCRPTAAYWQQFSFPNRYTEDFTCLYEGDVVFSNACISVVTDFLAALLPIFLFVQVRLPKRQKISLAILFGVGFLVCILGIVRAVLVHRLLYETYDVTWHSFYTWTATLTENHIGVICAAIPPLRPLFSRFYGIVTSTKSFRKTRAGHNVNHQDDDSEGGYILHNNNKSDKSDDRNNSNGNKVSGGGTGTGRQTPGMDGNLEAGNRGGSSPENASALDTSKPLPRIPSGLSQTDSIETDILITDLERGVSGDDNSRKCLTGNDSY